MRMSYHHTDMILLASQANQSILNSNWQSILILSYWNQNLKSPIFNIACNSKLKQLNKLYWMRDEIEDTIKVTNYEYFYLFDVLWLIAVIFCQPSAFIGFFFSGWFHRQVLVAVLFRKRFLAWFSNWMSWITEQRLQRQDSPFSSSLLRIEILARTEK